MRLETAKVSLPQAPDIPGGPPGGRVTVCTTVGYQRTGLPVRFHAALLCIPTPSVLRNNESYDLSAIWKTAKPAPGRVVFRKEDETRKAVSCVFVAAILALRAISCG